MSIMPIRHAIFFLGGGWWESMLFCFVLYFGNHFKSLLPGIWSYMNECFTFKLWFYQNALMYFIINGNKKTKYRDVVVHKYFSAEGYNRKFEDFDPSAHAEVVAIRNAGKALRTPELQGCILFTSCEPCPMCAATIWWSRFFFNNTLFVLNFAGTSFGDFGNRVFRRVLFSRF